MKEKTYSILKRFAKGTIAGAVSAMSMVSITMPTVWSDFKSILASLGMAATFGAITGLILALQKWASWQE